MLKLKAVIAVISFLMIFGFVGGVECDNIGLLAGGIGGFASVLVFGWATIPFRG